ncbi:hypothetical protein AGMMS50276_29330 [Synergistales bacterium]|nr:hypothetical protein AGMMS50276_29330 [Synergistales bacterium]
MQADIFSDPLLFSRLQTIENYRDKFYLYATTNLLGAAKLSDDELEYFLRQFSLLQISFGGPTKDDYRSMFGVDVFDIVNKQLDRIHLMIQKYKQPPTIHLYFRISDRLKLENSREFANLSKKFIVREVRDSFFSWGGLISQEDLPKGAILLESGAQSMMDDCAAAWATLSVSPDGRVLGCGCVDWKNKHIIGNMHFSKIKEIWQSEDAQRFRRGFSEGNAPDMCRICALYTSANKCFRANMANYKPSNGVYYNYNFAP